MAHDHVHDHHHGPQKLDHINRAFLWGIGLNLVFVGVEFAAGLWLDSLALLSDAGHNLSDTVSLVLAMLAFRLATVKPNRNYTYGYKKSTVLVSLLNACILLVAVGMILVSSIHKLQNPRPVDGDTVAWIAGVGILINAFTAWLFMKDKDRDLNIKGAYLHMAADALVSLGVLVSGVVIVHTGWYVIDPLIGIVIALVILLSTSRLLFDSLRLSLDGVPAGIDLQRVKRALLETDPAIAGVHHLHVWALSTTENALTVHIVLKEMARAPEIKEKIKHLLESFSIEHATLEMELPGEHCHKERC